MGKREVRQILIAKRRLCGQLSGEPSSLFDQSKDRIREAISLSPGKIRSNSGGLSRSDAPTIFPPSSHRTYVGLPARPTHVSLIKTAASQDRIAANNEGATWHWKQIDAPQLCVVA